MLDDEQPGDGEGEPLDEGRPEWDSVEAERDYWKSLALSYGAKLRAIEHTMGATWTVEAAADGWFVIRTDGKDATRVPIASLDELELYKSKP